MKNQKALFIIANLLLAIGLSVAMVKSVTAATLPLTPPLTPPVTPTPTIIIDRCRPVICRPGFRCPMRPDCIINQY